MFHPDSLGKKNPCDGGGGLCVKRLLLQLRPYATKQRIFAVLHMLAGALMVVLGSALWENLKVDAPPVLGFERICTGSNLPPASPARKTLDVDYLYKIRHGKHKKRLVFTSLGDHSVYKMWLTPTRTWDFIATYYRDNATKFDELCSEADMVITRKDGKFSNLHHLYKTKPGLLEAYDSVFVLDDDMRLSPTEIDELFEVREKYDLSLLAPSRADEPKFLMNAQHEPTDQIRFVNFVEMCFPLFKGDRLCEFLDVFDPQIKGWGADIWYSDMLNGTKKMATYDGVAVINPKFRTGQIHEIDTLQGVEGRKNSWQGYARTHGLPIRPPNNSFQFDGFMSAQTVLLEN